MSSSESFQLAAEIFQPSAEGNHVETFPVADDLPDDEESGDTGSRILLGLSGRALSSWVLHIAEKTISEMGCGLDILVYSCGPTLPLLLGDFLLKLDSAGIPYQMFFRHGPLGAEIRDYLRGRDNITMVLVDSLANWEPNKTSGAPWLKLECPVSVLSAI
jgi:hypothetical protein